MIAVNTNLPLPRHPKLDGFNLKLARILAEYSSRAYDPTPATRMKKGTPWSLFLDSDTTDARVLMEDAGDEIVLAFRGTHDAQDWLQDAKIEMVHYPYDDYGTKVHRGFLEDVMALFPKICERLERNLKPIFITGHSKGAAEASLCALMLSQFSKYDIHAVYSFASPRIGNALLRSEYNCTLKKKTFRVTIEGDLVPHTPAAWDGFRAVGNEVFFQPNGKYKINPWRWYELWKNEKRAGELLDWNEIAEYHSIGRSYIPALEKALSRESSSLLPSNAGSVGK